MAKGNKNHVVEISATESDLQMYRDETAAKMLSIEGSVAEMQNSMATLRTDLLSEVRAMLSELRAASPNPNHGPVPEKTEPPLLEVLTIEEPRQNPPVANTQAGVLGKAPTTTSSTLGVAGILTNSVEGSTSSNSSAGKNKTITYHELAHNEVILGLQSETSSQLNVGGNRSQNPGNIVNAQFVGANMSENSSLYPSMAFGTDGIQLGGGRTGIGHYMQAHAVCANLGVNLQAPHGCGMPGSIVDQINGMSLPDMHNFQHGVIDTSVPMVSDQFVARSNGGSRVITSHAGLNVNASFGFSTDHRGHYYSQHTDFGSQQYSGNSGPCLHQLIGSAPSYHFSTTGPATVRDGVPIMSHNAFANYATSSFSTMQVTANGGVQPSYPLQSHQHIACPLHPMSGTRSSNAPWLMSSPAAVPSTCPHQVMHNQYLDPTLPTMKQMKLDFVVFNGGDPVDWLNKAEQFFDFYQVPEEKKLAIATLHLADKASDRWYMFRNEFPQTWQGLSELLMREFSGYNAIDYQAALARMTQNGSVDGYMEQFTRLSRRTPGFSQQTLLSFFIGGLKNELKASVRALNPKSLYEACVLAKIFEEREADQKNENRLSPTTFKGGQSSFQTSNSTTSNAQGGFRNNAIVQTQNTGVGPNRRLSQEEFQERRAKNQCFFCEETFKPGHNCSRGQGQLMVIEIIQDEGEQSALRMEKLGEDADVTQQRIPGFDLSAGTSSGHT